MTEEFIMPISGMVLKDGASAMTPTGGSDMTFQEDGVSVVNGKHVANAAQTDFRIRENLTVKIRKATYQGGVFTSKDKKTVSYVEPKILADGSIAYNVIRLEREVHPETTAAEALNLNMMGAQLLSDSDIASFWSADSTA